MENSGGPDRADPNKRVWLYVLVGVLVVALVAGGILLFVGDEKKKRDFGPNLGAGIKQASWRVRVRTVGGPALPKKIRNQKLKGKEAKRLETLVRSIYNAIYLQPGRLDHVSKRFMSAEVAKAVKRSGPQIPAKADRIKTMRRLAKVGVDPAGIARAVAFVHVVAKGEKGKEKFKTQSRDRLWLERNKGKWKIIAFDVNMEALPLGPRKDKTGGKDGGGKTERKDGKKKDGKKRKGDSK